MNKEIDNRKNILLKLLNVKELNFTEKGFVDISNYFLEKNKLKIIDDTEFKCFQYYVGEFFMKYIGAGNWKQNNIKKDPAYKRMCVVNWAEGAIRFDPEYSIIEYFNQENPLYLFNKIKETKKNMDNIDNVFKKIGL